MKIFPAIDIKDGKCVRLVKGDFNNKIEYEMSPVEQANKYKDHGFKNLHVVDLDGALAGETINIDIIQNIVSKFGLKVEIIKPCGFSLEDKRFKRVVMDYYNKKMIKNL